MNYKKTGVDCNRGLYIQSEYDSQGLTDTKKCTKDTRRAEICWCFLHMFNQFTYVVHFKAVGSKFFKHKKK